MVRARYLCVMSLTSLIGLAGCEGNHYEIELTPKKGAIERDIATWHTGGGRDINSPESKFTDFPEEELAQIASAYNSPVPKKLDAKHRFQGEFKGKLPNDVGGDGRYHYWETSLGSLSGYIERFRGNDDLLTNVEQRLQAADRLVDLAIGWLEKEVKGEPGFPELRTFLDIQFRRDLKNLSLYAWSNALTVDFQFEQAISEMAARAGQYFAERGYFDWEQLPELSQALEEADDGDPRRLLEMIQKSLAAKINAKGQANSKCLAFLSNHYRAANSLNAYLRKSEEFKALMKEWREGLNDNTKRKPPQPMDVVQHLAEQAFELSAISLAFSGDPLSVKLALPVPPTFTNGEWDEDARRIQWKKVILSKDGNREIYPTLLYAIWSEPDSPAQTRMFGKVLLEGKPLEKYCLWYHTLSATQAGQWEVFLSSLKPEQDLEARLRSFKFEEAIKTDPAKTGKKLLLNRLKSDK